MKKLLTLFALMFMTFTVNAQTSLEGDMNHDGELTILDVMKLVSIILGNEKQSFLTCPNDNHPHLIDLGLPSGTKWACCNVGAYYPENYGEYYAWGEIEKKVLMMKAIIFIIIVQLIAMIILVPTFVEQNTTLRMLSGVKNGKCLRMFKLKNC